MVWTTGDRVWPNLPGFAAENHWKYLKKQEFPGNMLLWNGCLRFFSWHCDGDERWMSSWSSTWSLLSSWQPLRPWRPWQRVPSNPHNALPRTRACACVGCWQLSDVKEILPGDEISKWKWCCCWENPWESWLTMSTMSLVNFSCYACWSFPSRALVSEASRNLSYPLILNGFW